MVCTCVNELKRLLSGGSCTTLMTYSFVMQPASSTSFAHYTRRLTNMWSRLDTQAQLRGEIGASVTAATAGASPAGAVVFRPVSIVGPTRTEPGDEGMTDVLPRIVAFKFSFTNDDGMSEIPPVPCLHGVPLSTLV